MPTPAFAMARSNVPPSSSSPRRTARWSAVGFVTSHAIETALPGRLARTPLSASWRRARSASDQPRFASSRASAAPIPLDAPVMMAFFDKQGHYLRMRFALVALIVATPLRAGFLYDFVTTVQTPRYSVRQSGRVAVQGQSYRADLDRRGIRDIDVVIS